jgi:hypothetical protein
MSQRDDRAIIHSFETGRGKRVAILVAALIAIALVVWNVGRSFHGRQVNTGARALTQPPETEAPRPPR